MIEVLQGFRDQRSPCLLVLDLSVNSAADAIDVAAPASQLNEGLRLLQDELHANPAAQHNIEISIINAGGPGQDAQLLQDWANAAEFQPPPVAGGGLSHLAQGMRLGLQHVEQRKLHLRRSNVACTRPWIMMVSNGRIDEPDDLWENVSRDCKRAERERRCVIFPILLDGGSREMQQKMRAMVQQMTATRMATMVPDSFPRYFRWLAASLTATSRSSSGNPVRLPPADWARFA